jgi:hypothetical protein
MCPLAVEVLVTVRTGQEKTRKLLKLSKRCPHVRSHLKEKVWPFMDEQNGYDRGKGLQSIRE